MANKIVLISDDADFFDFIRAKISLRKSDELFTFSFDDVPEKIHLLRTALLIINSENSRDKTIDLLKIFKGTPTIVIAYNEDSDFKDECYKAGMFDFLTILTPDSEFQTRLLPALTVSSMLEKSQQYREILVKNGVLSANNEVYLDYNYVLDKELGSIIFARKKAVFGAISPSEKNKLLISSNTMESIILNNIRKNDILMNYAPNKYFVILYDTDLASVNNLWDKIKSQFTINVYAGFSTILNQSRQQLINEVLNKLHEAINYDKDSMEASVNPVNNFSMVQGSLSPYTNFKQFKQEFDKNMEKIVTPVFYQIQQKYTDKLVGYSIQHGFGDGYGCFYIKGKSVDSSFRITSPGFSKINIDITYQKQSGEVDAKRISLEPEELEAGLLEDLLEQFISEFRRGE